MTGESRTQLVRVLGLAFGLAVVVGSVVGQGILRTPGMVAGAVPQVELIIALWLVCGLLVIVDACSAVELGSAIPCSGGPYVLIRRAWGPIGGTVAGWADWLNGALIIAFLAVVFGEFCLRLGLGADWPPGSLALLLILACWGLNMVGTRVSGASQTLLSAIKGLVLTAMVVALLLFGKGAPATQPMPIGAIGFGGVVLALNAIYNTYAGWTGSIYFGEEMVAPDRNIARSTFGGLLFVTILYVSVNVALLQVLTPAQMAASTLPAAEAVTAVGGASAGDLLTLFSILSVAAIANVYTMATARINFAMARDGVLPAAMAKTSRSGSPRVALTINAVLASVAALSGTYEEIVAAVVPLTLMLLAMIDIGAIILRRREPELRRPFRMPFYPLPALIGAAINIALIAASIIVDPWHAAGGIIAGLLLGIGYALAQRARTAA